MLSARAVMVPHPSVEESDPRPPINPVGLIPGLLIRLIRLYQVGTRWKPPVCRFEPSCSEYARQAILKYGAGKGSWRALRRICRCHPWNPGGYDPVE